MVRTDGDGQVRTSKVCGQHHAWCQNTRERLIHKVDIYSKPVILYYTVVYVVHRSDVRGLQNYIHVYVWWSYSRKRPSEYSAPLNRGHGLMYQLQYTYTSCVKHYHLINRGHFVHCLLWAMHELCTTNELGTPLCRGHWRLPQLSDLCTELPLN